MFSNHSTAAPRHSSPRPLRRNCPMQNKANSGSAPMRLRLIECGSLVVLLLWAFAIFAFSAEKPAAVQFYRRQRKKARRRRCPLRRPM